MLSKNDQKNLDKMFSELRSLGYKIDDAYYFANYKGDYKNALPILLKYIEEIEDPVQKEGIVRSVSVRGFTESVPVLLREYKKARKSSLKWAIGNALWIIGDKSIADEIIQLLEEEGEVEDMPKNWPKDAKHPEVSAKETLLWALGKTQDRKAVPVLLDYLHREWFTGHALEGLKYFKDPSLLDVKKIEPALKHPMGWVRKKAEKLMAQFKKKS